jgi:hypothetical protein
VRAVILITNSCASGFQPRLAWEPLKCWAREGWFPDDANHAEA